MYKFIDNLPRETIKKYSVKNNHRYYLRSESELLVPISILSFNPIQDGPFWGCSRMGGRGEQKGLPCLKYVTHILQR